MPLLPPINSSAVQVLQQSKINPNSFDKNISPNNDILATLSGGSNQVKTEDVKTADDYWGVLRVNPTEMKIKLFDRLAEAFGVERKDFKSLREFGHYIQLTVEKMKETPQGRLELAEIRKDLNLGEWGISMETLIDAAAEPDGTANDKLEAAIAHKLKDDETLDEALESLKSVNVDGNGVYSLAG